MFRPKKESGVCSEAPAASYELVVCDRYGRQADVGQERVLDRDKYWSILSMQVR
jgi:hypothetical protein